MDTSLQNIPDVCIQFLSLLQVPHTMFRLYSKGCEYALRALLEMAPAAGGRAQRFQAKAICEKAGIPESFTRKVFQSLAQAGFLIAARGPGGGYELTKKPGNITLLSIIRAVDGEETFGACIMGLAECDAEQPCPLHTTWATAKNDLLSQLESRSLQDLLDTVHRRGLRSDEAVDVVIPSLAD